MLTTVVRQDRGHAGADCPRFIVQGGVAYGDALHVDDGVERAGGQGADDDAGIAGAGALVARRVVRPGRQRKQRGGQQEWEPDHPANVARRRCGNENAGAGPAFSVGRGYAPDASA